VAEGKPTLIEQLMEAGSKAAEAAKERFRSIGGIFGSTGEAIGDWIKGLLPYLFTVLTDTLPTLAQRVLNIVLSDTLGLNREEPSGLINNLVALGVIDERVARQLTSSLNRAGTAEPVLTIVVYLIAWVYFALNSVTVPGGVMKQQLAKIYHPEPPPPEAVIRAAFIAPERIGKVKDALLRAGFAPDDIELLFLGAYRLYDIETVRSLYHRGAISEATVYERLREMGLTDVRIGELLKSWPTIPGISDLIYMAVKEAFDEEASRLFTLDANYPEGIDAPAAAQGLSPEWRKRYWRAHWVHPSAGQGMEMLHRGVIGEEELRTLLRVLDYPEYWRDKLMAISYLPYTRVDARRMYQIGVLDEAGLYKAYREMGYDHEHATGLTSWTKVEYAQEDRELTRGQVESAYIDRVLSRAEAEALLKELRYSDERVKLILDMADYRQRKDMVSEAIDTIKDLYVDAGIEAQEARDRLAKLNVEGSYIEVLLDRWTVLRSKRVALPSKTDLDKFLSSRVITERQYREQMRKLGYSELYIDWYLGYRTASAMSAAQAASYKEAQEAAKASSEADYLSGTITDMEARERLTKAGLSDNQISTLLARWALKKLVSAKKLTRGELDSMLRAKAISLERYSDEMAKLGYTAEQIASLAKLAEREPTKSDWDQLAATGIIDEAGYREELAKLGYDPEDIDLYVKLNIGGGA